MKFNKIVCVDRTKLRTWAVEELQEYSEREIVEHNDYPESDAEVIKRIGDAEAVLVSWKTQINKEIIQNCPNLKYIGMACSLYDSASANVAVDFARQKGITVKGIKDYGDPGVIEFIISELIRLLHGFGQKQWKEMPLELTNRKIGIIGLGTTGQMLAKCLLPFGADLYYFSRRRKIQWEEKGVEFLPIHKLLETVDVISFHLPRNTRIIKEDEFEHLGNGKILINTSLGLPFDKVGFKKWVRQKGNFAIFDRDGKAELPEELLSLKNIIASEKSAGWSAETHERLSRKVVDNLKKFVK